MRQEVVSKTYLLKSTLTSSCSGTFSALMTSKYSRSLFKPSIPAKIFTENAFFGIKIFENIIKNNDYAIY